MDGKSRIDLAKGGVLFNACIKLLDYFEVSVTQQQTHYLILARVVFEIGDRRKMSKQVKILFLSKIFSNSPRHASAEPFRALMCVAEHARKERERRVVFAEQRKDFFDVREEKVEQVDRDGSVDIFPIFYLLAWDEQTTFITCLRRKLYVHSNPERYEIGFT